jgi:hypothetical protein
MPLVFGVMGIVQKGATTVAAVKRIAKEAATDKVTDGHATNGDLVLAEKAEIENASRGPAAAYVPTDSR